MSDFKLWVKLGFSNAVRIKLLFLAIINLQSPLKVFTYSNNVHFPLCSVHRWRTLFRMYSVQNCLINDSNDLNVLVYLWYLYLFLRKAITAKTIRLGYKSN